MTTRTQYLVAASLDGFIADADGKLDWLFQFNDAEGLMAHVERFTRDVGALCMGAATYEFLLAQGGPWPYPGLPAWVFTHRALPVPEGADVRLTHADVGEVHARMVEAAAGRNVWLMGGGGLVAQFAARGLLDELHLGVIPVVLGRGAPLLPLTLTQPFTLTDVSRFGMGVVELRYTLPRGARPVS